VSNKTGFKISPQIYFSHYCMKNLLTALG